MYVYSKIKNWKKMNSISHLKSMGCRLVKNLVTRMCKYIGNTDCSIDAIFSIVSASYRAKKCA